MIFGALYRYFSTVKNVVSHKSDFRHIVAHKSINMGPLKIKKGVNIQNKLGAWVEFGGGQASVFVAEHHWVGFDFDGTISRTDNPGHFSPPYPLGEPIPEMIAAVKSLLESGITVKIFTARACEPENIPAIQDWTERHGLGRLAVTHQKDYDLIRFFDDRAIPVIENSGKLTAKPI